MALSFLLEWQVTGWYTINYCIIPYFSCFSNGNYCRDSTVFLCTVSREMCDFPIEIQRKIVYSYCSTMKGGVRMYELSWNPMADLEDLIYEERQMVASER